MVTRGCFFSCEKRRRRFRITVALLSHPALAKLELQAPIGNLIQPIMHARCFMGLFGQAYRIINNMHEGRLRRWGH